MTLNLVEPLRELKALIQAALNDETVYVGVPGSGQTRKFVYVTLGGVTPFGMSAGRCVSWTVNYRIVAAYSLDDAAVAGGEEETAEEAMAAIVALLLPALEVGRNTHLDSTVESVERIDASGADEPRYQLWSGLEHREYPIVVTVLQSETF